MDSKLERVDLAEHPVILNLDSVALEFFSDYHHYHEGIELLFIHEGRGMVSISGLDYPIKPGQLYFFQPFQPHSIVMRVDPLHPYRRSVITFNPAALLPYVQAFPLLSPIYLELWKGHPVRQCLEAGEEGTGFIRRLQLRFPKALEQQHLEGFAVHLLSLLDMLAAGGNGFHDADGSSIRKNRYSKAVIQWLDEHLDQPFSLDTLAEALHLSSSHVSRRFKAETGISIQEFMTFRRIQSACQMLKTTDLPVELVAQSVGFSSTSYFCKLFKTHTGMSPLQYAKSRANGLPAASDDQ